MGRFTIPDALYYGRPNGWDDSEFEWVCGCQTPRPDTIGECASCFRPVYGDDGVRVCRS